MIVDHVCYLTTKDNPFNPVLQFDDWFAFDLRKNYNTASYLAHEAHTAEGLGIAENYAEIERAIDRIIQEHPNGNYVKVTVPVTIEPAFT